jgi:hypothetical protein
MLASFTILGSGGIVGILILALVICAIVYVIRRLV